MKMVDAMCIYGNNSIDSLSSPAHNVLTTSYPVRLAPSIEQSSKQCMLNNTEANSIGTVPSVEQWFKWHMYISRL